MEQTHKSEPWQAFSASRPKNGDEVRYRGELIGSVHHCEKAICHVQKIDNGEFTLFIWAFKDGLNKLHDWPTKKENQPTGKTCPFCESDYEPICHCIGEELAALSNEKE